MNFNIFNSIILAGVIQGFVFSIVWLVNKKYRARNTYFLISLIVVYSLSNLQYYLLDTGFINTPNFYSYLYIGWSLLMPALFYFYGAILLDSEKVVSRKEKLLYVPFLIAFILGLLYKFQVTVLGRESGFSVFNHKLISYSELLAIAMSLAVLTFLFLKITQSIKSRQFSIKKVHPQIQWFRIVLILQFVAVVLWTYSEIKYGYSSENYYFYPIWILLALIIYWMGHVGIYKYGIDEQRKKIRKYSSERYSIAELHKGKSESLDAFENFIITEKNYLNPQISLENVASELNISSGHLSKIINNDLGISFKDYLNKLRVTEAKTYLQNPEFSNYTLVAIGLEAGFNSKSAFNASFKKITGLTPSQFKSQQTN